MSNPICPACEQGEGELLGELGNLKWFCCRACGMQFNKRIKIRKRRKVQEMCSVSGEDVKMRKYEENEQIQREDLADAVWKLPKLPRNTPRIDRLRWIVYHHQAARMEGRLVDGFTASMLVQIHDALGEANRIKFLSLKLDKMVSVGWKLAKK